MTSYEFMIDLLPYHLQNSENTNKIFKVWGKMFDDIIEIYNQLGNIGNPDSTGDILDLTGKLVEEYRNGQTDEKFRQRIITKLVRNFSKGDIETINGLGRVLFGENYVGVIEKYNRSVDPEPAAMTLIYDFSVITDNPVDLFKTALAGGVSLDTKIQTYAYMFDFYEPGVTNLAQSPILINP